MLERFGLEIPVQRICLDSVDYVGDDATGYEQVYATVRRLVVSKPLKGDNIGNKRLIVWITNVSVIIVTV